MASYGKWYFTTEQLSNSPSKRDLVDADTEMRYKQEAAMFIQKFGEQIQLSQMCINTAIVYMHRFYVYHSFKYFHRHQLAATALWLASKVEGQSRPMEIIIRVAFPHLLGKIESSLVPSSYMYKKLAREMVVNESILLETLGFELTIVHPHTYILRCCEMIEACPDFVKWAILFANNSFHLTSMCLRYPPKIMACFCVYLMLKWSTIESPVSSEGKPWFLYIDATVTEYLLEEIVTEFLDIFGKCEHSRLKQELASVNKLPGASVTPDSGYESPEQLALKADPQCPIKKMALAKMFRLEKMKLYARK